MRNIRQANLTPYTPQTLSLQHMRAAFCADGFAHPHKNILSARMRWLCEKHPCAAGEISKPLCKTCANRSHMCRLSVFHPNPYQ